MKTEYEQYGMYLGMGAMDFETKARIDAQEDRLTGDYLVRRLQEGLKPFEVDMEFDEIMHRRYGR